MCVSKFICVSYEFSLALYFFLFVLSYSSVFLFVYYYDCCCCCYIPLFISIRMNRKMVDLGMWGSGKYLGGLVEGKL